MSSHYLITVSVFPKTDLEAETEVAAASSNNDRAEAMLAA